MATIDDERGSIDEPRTEGIFDDRFYFDKDVPTLLALVAESAKRQAEQLGQKRVAGEPLRSQS